MYTNMSYAGCVIAEVVRRTLTRVIQAVLITEGV